MKKRKKKVDGRKPVNKFWSAALGQLDYLAEQSEEEPSRDTSGRRRFYPAHCRVWSTWENVHDPLLARCPISAMKHATTFCLKGDPSPTSDRLPVKIT